MASTQIPIGNIYFRENGLAPVFNLLHFRGWGKGGKRKTKRKQPGGLLGPTEGGRKNRKHVCQSGQVLRRLESSIHGIQGYT